MTKLLPTTREQYPLSKKKILKKSISTIFAVVIILLSLLLLPSVFKIAFHATFSALVSESAVMLFSGIGISLVILAIVMVGLDVLYQYWYFKTYFYDLTENVLVIRKNPITPSEISIPYEKLQDVYLDQDFVDRALKIYDLHISSATATSGEAAHIDGLGLENAMQLKALILAKMEENSLKVNR